MQSNAYILWTSFYNGQFVTDIPVMCFEEFLN